MDRSLAKIFATPRDASVAMGAIAGFLYACEASLGRESFPLIPGIFIPLLPLLGPAVAMRSASRAALAVLYALLMIVPMSILLPPINGRYDLPLSVWGAPYANVWVPWYDNLPLGWQARACVRYFAYWFLTGIAILAMSLPVGTHGVRLSRLMFQTNMAALFATILYVFTWQALVSGTFARPLYSNSELWASLSLYGASFAIVPYFLFYGATDVLVARDSEPIRQSIDDVTKPAST